MTPNVFIVIDDLILIELKSGKTAIINAVDYDLIKNYHWHCERDHNAYYAKSAYHGISLRMHRIILNAPKDYMVDHINGDGLDNRKCNLRLCTSAENQRNRMIQVNNGSGFKGVYWATNLKRWFASIQVDRKHIHLGYYDSKVQAARAYDVAAKIYHGEFCRVNSNE